MISFKLWLENMLSRRNFLGGAVAAGAGLLGRKVFGGETDTNEKEADRKFKEIQERFEALRKPSNQDWADAKAKAENNFKQNAIKYQEQDPAEVKVIIAYWFILDAITKRLVATLNLKEDKIQEIKPDFNTHIWVQQNFPENIWKAYNIPIYKRFKKVLALSFKEEVQAKMDAHAYGKGTDFFGSMPDDIRRINADLEKVKSMADKVKQNIEEEKMLMRKHGEGKFVDDYEFEELNNMHKRIDKLMPKYQQGNVSKQEINKDQTELLDMLMKIQNKNK